MKVQNISEEKEEVQIGLNTKAAEEIIGLRENMNTTKKCENQAEENTFLIGTKIRGKFVKR